MEKCPYFIIYLFFFVPSLSVGMYNNSTIVTSGGGVIQGFYTQTAIKAPHDLGLTLQDSKSTFHNRKQRRAQGNHKQQATRDQQIVQMDHIINKHILNTNNDSCVCDKWLKYWSAPWLNSFDQALEKAEEIESYLGKMQDEQVIGHLAKINYWFNYVHSSLINYTAQEAYKGSFITGNNIDLLLEEKGSLFPSLSKALSKSVAYHVKRRYTELLKNIDRDQIPMLTKNMVLEYKLGSGDVYISDDGRYIKALDEKGYDFIWDLYVDRDDIWYLFTGDHVKALNSNTQWIKMLPYSKTRWNKDPYYYQYGEYFVIYKGSRAYNEEQWDSEDGKVHLSMFLLDIDEDKEKYERRLIVEFIPSVESRTCDIAFFNSKSEADFNAVLNSNTFKKLPLVQQRLLQSRAYEGSAFGAKVLANGHYK